jgi:RNA polymerase sigma-70 factor (ECF subfamily)
MQAFLSSVETRAFGIAHISTGNRDDALDIVQETMMKLVQNYSQHPESEWKPLFYSILQTKIQDWRRRQTVRNRFRVWFHRDDDEDETEDPLEQVSGDAQLAPDFQLENTQFSQQLDKALRRLSPQQQQAFLLRLWEGMDIQQTAKAMKCSESSVKTHYARALERLREALGDHYGE